MKKTLALLLVNAFAASASAFSREEHEAITRLAGKRFNECVARGESVVGTRLLDAGVEMMSNANSFEDLNVAKKWTVASHFYNPIKKFDWGKVGGGGPGEGGGKIGRGDADVAIRRALSKLERYNELEKRIGQMLHYVQDMSSPLHVIGVNHGLTDGFENNRAIDAVAAAAKEKISCERAEGKPRDPMAVLRANAVMTLKISDQTFNYRQSGDARTHRAKWSETFYVNPGLTSAKLSSLLKKFEPLGRMFQLGRADYPAGSLDTLPRGSYGAFADKGLLHRDNFGKTDFNVSADGIKRAIRIEREEYLQYKKKLVLEAVQASMETIAWGLMNQDVDDHVF